jgi:hypothetical protein
MSDSIDHQDAEPDRTPREPLLTGESGDISSPEPGISATQQMSFDWGTGGTQEISSSVADESQALDTASEQNLRQLLKDVESLRRTGQVQAEVQVEVQVEAPMATESFYVDRFIERARAHYANQNFKTSLEVLHDGLKLAPGNADIIALAEEVQRASEQRQTELEESGLADRIAQCKSEAVTLFEQGRYADCIERFKVLSEIDPTNSDLRDYLEVSREQAEKAEKAELAEKAESAKVGEPSAEPVESPVAAPVSDPQDEEPTLAGPSSPESVYVPMESKKDFYPDPPTLPSRLFEPDPEEEKVQDEQDLAQKDSSPEYPVAVQLQQLRLKAREEEWKPETLDEDSDLPEDPAQAGSKKLRVACLAGVGLIIGAMLGAWLALAPLKRVRQTAETVQPERTPVVVDPVLSDPAASPAQESDPLSHAQKAFEQGKLLEANRLCDKILQAAPDDAVALGLKEQIRSRYLKSANLATAQQNWAEASMAWYNLLKVVPGDRDAQRQLKAARANLKGGEQLALAQKLESENRIAELHEQIKVAMSSGHHLPPTPGNAFDLIVQLQKLSFNDAFGREQFEEIQRHLAASVGRAIQTKDFVKASAMVRQLETYFPEAPELRNLSDGLKTEQARVAEARSSSMRKAEIAMTAGHFVTPASDNVLAYCNELLAQEPQNAKALDLKKASLTRASAQATAWIQEGKYDDARSVYSALLYVPQGDLPGSLNSQQLKAEIEKLTFNAHAVVHDHTLGSCSGRLRFNGYQIAYIPSSDSKDGFAAKLSEITQVESDDKLRIQLKGKTYRFHINGVKDPQEVRTRISDIQREMSALVANNK